MGYTGGGLNWSNICDSARFRILSCPPLSSISCLILSPPHSLFPSLVSSLLSCASLSLLSRIVPLSPLLSLSYSLGLLLDCCTGTHNLLLPKFIIRKYIYFLLKVYICPIINLSILLYAHLLVQNTVIFHGRMYLQYL